ncbi:sec14 [Symbiodinium sp. CCMP2592]|nr:sec14 [Symbiodinium sp. CCMP2592]
MQQAQMGPGAMGNMAGAGQMRHKHEETKNQCGLHLCVAMSDGDLLDRYELAKSRRPEIESLGDELKRDGIEVDEQELLAFLRATNFDQQEARARLLDTTDWRAATLVKEKLHCSDWRAKELAMRSILLYDYVGADKHGRPVLIERVGAWDIQAVLDATEDLEKFTILHAMADETLLQMQRPATATDPRGFVLIVDMEGLGIWHLQPRLISAFAAVSQIDESHYPDTVAHIFVVNAPWYFTSLFAMIRPFLNEDTYTKIHFSRYVPDNMLQCLGEDCLPVELGGLRAGIFPYSLDASPSRHPEPLLAAVQT